ncbi:hypothetical protein HYFRA_00012251 [Hymenoscyphus fraxineus]|uniref:Uncharacterized protein n=1 Tax=Hymenoscyphus fraxineus TaxID=746836 RepID=A0A9N9PWK8_9HELO|nr:hypothetical protein HYFRA_00012251 [Hymenoscyphus fraxineus]
MPPPIAPSTMAPDTDPDRDQLFFYKKNIEGLRGQAIENDFIQGLDEIAEFDQVYKVNLQKAVTMFEDQVYQAQWHAEYHTVLEIAQKHGMEYSVEEFGIQMPPPMTQGQIEACKARCTVRASASSSNVPTSPAESSQSLYAGEAAEVSASQMARVSQDSSHNADQDTISPQAGKRSRKRQKVAGPGYREQDTPESESDAASITGTDSEPGSESDYDTSKKITVVEIQFNEYWTREDEEQLQRDNIVAPTLANGELGLIRRAEAQFGMMPFDLVPEGSIPRKFSPEFCSSFGKVIQCPAFVGRPDFLKFCLEMARYHRLGKPYKKPSANDFIGSREHSVIAKFKTDLYRIKGTMSEVDPDVLKALEEQFKPHPNKPEHFAFHKGMKDSVTKKPRRKDENGAAMTKGDLDAICGAWDEYAEKSRDSTIKTIAETPQIKLQRGFTRKGQQSHQEVALEHKRQWLLNKERLARRADNQIARSASGFDDFRECSQELPGPNTRTAREAPQMQIPESPSMQNPSGFHEINPQRPTGNHFEMSPDLDEPEF